MSLKPTAAAPTGAGVKPAFAANDPAPPVRRHCHAFPVHVWRKEGTDKHNKVPKVPKGCDWHTYDAPADVMRKARNIGVVIPEGVVILDLDSYKGITRDAVDKQLGCALEWSRALLQTTVSGGEHYVFGIPEGAVIKQGANVAGIEGLDTRTTGKGWICSGRGYTVREGLGNVLTALQSATFPMLPAAAIEKLSDSTPRTAAPAGDADIIVGGRNDALASMAGQLRHVGMDEADILDALLQQNARRCKPPLPEDEVRAIAQSVARYAPGAGMPDADADEPLDLSHDELALQMGSEFGWNEVARYVHTWRSWLFWDGARWARDDKLRHLTMCRKFLLHVVIQLEREAKKDIRSNPKAAAAIVKQTKAKAEWLRSSATVNAVESMARSNAELAATADQFDANLDVLGTPGGTVDLRTGKLRPTLRADYITRNAAVAPSNTTPSRWLQFLHEAMDGDAEMIAFLQRLAGYALTGHTTEHKLPFLFGPGGNGKSVFANTLHGLFGDYSARAPAEAFLQTRNERHPTDLAGLAGARLVVASELPAGRAWNESVIKDLTGGDAITARFMRQDFFTFTPQFALLIVGNHMPSIGSVDEAMRRRIVLVPFVHEVPVHKRDPELEAKLRPEWPGILQWAIEGAVAWYRDGLRVPGKVAGASGEYLDAEDELGQFMDERLRHARRSAGDLSSVIYAAYAAWVEPRGGRAMTQRAFSQAMRERGVSITKQNDGRHCSGWWLKENA